MHEIATIGSILLLNVVRSYSIVTMMLTICQKSPHRQRTNKLSDPKQKRVTMSTRILTKTSHICYCRRKLHPKKVYVGIAKITLTKIVSREYPTKYYILG